MFLLTNRCLISRFLSNSIKILKGVVMPKKSQKNEKDIGKEIQAINEKIEGLVNQVIKIRGNQCYPLLQGDSLIVGDTVDKVFEELRHEKYADCKKLDVLIESGGGDIDAAYNLCLLFRKFGEEQLTIIVPRWAKSAATVLACSGDKLLMTPVAELGPVDPQITQISPMEGRVEKFSPLHIESTLELIRDEYENGNTKLADKLMERLQFPLTLGRFKKSLELGNEYIKTLLKSRMLKDSPEKAETIAKALTHKFPDHSYCLQIDELKKMGFKAEELNGDLLNVIWDIYCNVKKRHKLITEKKNIETKKKLKGIPKELLDQLPDDLIDRLKLKPQSGDRLDNLMNSLSISTKLAALLLLQYKELSITDIETLPFVENRETAIAIADRLAEVFNVEQKQIKMGSSPISQWENVLLLKS